MRPTLLHPLANFDEQHKKALPMRLPRSEQRMRVAVLLILAAIFNAPLMTLRSRLFGLSHQHAAALPKRRMTLVRAAVEEKMALVVNANCCCCSSCYCTAD
jgi:hypothetical protein